MRWASQKKVGVCLAFVMAVNQITTRDLVCDMHSK
jgi:hypothetical protein